MKWLKTQIARWLINHPDLVPEEAVDWAYDWYNQGIQERLE